MRLLPSWRSLLIGLALLAAALGAYLLARNTSLFAVRSIDVQGAPPALAARIRAVLAPVVGVSLLRLDGADVERRVAALPEVLAVSHDRAFPHTLRITVRTERPVAILRQGAGAWLVSARGRVLSQLAHPERSQLPRIWVRPKVPISLGARLPDDGGGRAVQAVVPLDDAHFPAVVRFARDAGELTLVLRSGTEIRLGDPGDLRLKLAIAGRILRLATARRTAFSYLDVSVPERPVAG